MNEVRSAEWKAEAELVQQALGDLGPRERCSILWAMRRNPSGWSPTQARAMHWLQRANLKSARAWRLKMALREVYALARSHNDAGLAAADLRRWTSWARRSRLEQFKRLGATLSEHLDAVVRGMLDHRSNAFVEAMNGLMQQAKRAARGFRTTHGGQLHRHRIPAAGQAHAPSGLPVRSRHAAHFMSREPLNSLARLPHETA